MSRASSILGSSWCDRKEQSRLEEIHIYKEKKWFNIGVWHQYSSCGE